MKKTISKIPNAPAPKEKPVKKVVDTVNSEITFSTDLRIEDMNGEKL